MKSRLDQFPPWKQYDYPQGSMGWRMGSGERYMNSWIEWFSSLSPSDQKLYIEENPTPEDWILFYEYILVIDSEERYAIFEKIEAGTAVWLEMQYSLYEEYKEKGDMTSALKSLEKVVKYNGRYKNASETYNRLIKSNN